MDALDRLIVALDVPTAEDARNLIATLGESVRVYKVGKQLFTALGPDFVRELRASDRKVFLDLKYKDIPNTVAGAVAENLLRPHDRRGLGIEGQRSPDHRSDRRWRLFDGRECALDSRAPRNSSDDRGCR